MTTTIVFLAVVLVLALLSAALLGWLGDRARTGRAKTPRESRDQSERIRAGYMSKEQRAREIRERVRRERARREPRPASGDAGARQAETDRPSVPRSSPSEARHRATLELTGPVTPETLRRHYRRLVTAYHPDRVAGLGIKLQKLAEEETKAINEAYAFFKKQLGL